MKLSLCKRESEVITALRSGAPSAEQDEHCASCASCTEARRAASLMLRYAASVDVGGLQPLSANRIWRQAQVRRQEHALRRATRALAWMQAPGAAYVTILLVWSARVAWLHLGTETRTGWASLENGTVLAGAGLALLFVAGGAGILFLLGRREDRSFLPA